MVIDCGGNYCFSYRGYLGYLEGNLYFFGICMDVFLYILISDINLGLIYMFDENG